MAFTVDVYNPEWPRQFDQLKTRLERFLSDVRYISIEHVGSTSVPGLAAKPIIDIDIIVTPANLDAAVSALTSHGFKHLGDLGIVDRHVVVDADQNPPRNTYVCIEEAFSLRNHLGLRNALRENAELRDEYSAVKMGLAGKGVNIVEYIEAKNDIVQKILMTSNLLTPEELEQIRDANVQHERFKLMRTERLVLREFDKVDIPGYFELERNEENARYQSWEPRTLEQASECVLDVVKASGQRPRVVWELVVEKDKRMIGRVGGKVTRPHSEEKSDALTHFDLWFSLLPSEQGKGYASEAMKKFIEALVEREDGKKIEFEIECDPRNSGSWKLAERLGFEKFSLTEKAWQCKGEWVDSLVYRKVVG